MWHINLQSSVLTPNTSQNWAQNLGVLLGLLCCLLLSKYLLSTCPSEYKHCTGLCSLIAFHVHTDAEQIHYLQLYTQAVPQILKNLALVYLGVSSHTIKRIQLNHSHCRTNILDFFFHHIKYKQSNLLNVRLFFFISFFPTSRPGVDSPLLGFFINMYFLKCPTSGHYDMEIANNPNTPLASLCYYHQMSF